MQRETDEIREDLLALLAASRELSPDLDRHLVDSFLERTELATRAARPVTSVAPAHSLGARRILGALTALAALLLIVIVLVPLGRWTGSHTMPETVYLGLWFTMVGAALAALLVMVSIIVRERFGLSLTRFET